MSLEEFDGLVDSHFEHIVDICAMEFDVEDIVFEAFAVAGFAWKHKVCHELHRYSDSAFALADRATTTIDIEREVGWRESHLLRELLVGKKFSDVVVGF